MRCCVTGGAGFIGSHVVERLVAEGHQVVVVDDLSTGRAEWVVPPARLVEGDVLDPAGWAEQVGPVDVVLHLAAQVSVAAGEAHPSRDARINLEGTLAILEWALRAGAREVRFASSAAVYGDPSRLPLREDDAAAPLSFYGIHKLAAEWGVRRFAERHGMSAVVLRLANVYGPRQRADGEGGVVAIFADALAHGRTPTVYGDGLQTRDFIYVADVARAFAWRLLAEPSQVAVLNVSTGIALSIRELWERLTQIAGVDAKPLHPGPPRPGDIRHSRLDPARLLAWGLGPPTPLQEGLRATWEYFAASAHTR
ncbi:MAG: NAD-dependent epimerase/dehydratase family protein [Firmicutes bacterium]|nr:NAD-dependent epimerase/dehydratase family protein [Bacillota bacterium]